MNNLTRRNFVGRSALFAGAAALPALLRAEDKPQAASDEQRPSVSGQENVTPVWKRAPLEPRSPRHRLQARRDAQRLLELPFRIVDGVKVFHLVCEEVDHVFVPKTEFNDELRAHCWGFNGSVHGPTIECVEGDRVRIYVTNKLPAATSMHWHGVIVPSGWMAWAA